jgi:hypothetical protein
MLKLNSTPNARFRIADAHLMNFSRQNICRHQRIRQRYFDERTLDGGSARVEDVIAPPGIESVDFRRRSGEEPSRINNVSDPQRHIGPNYRYGKVLSKIISDDWVERCVVQG